MKERLLAHRRWLVLAVVVLVTILAAGCASAQKVSALQARVDALAKQVLDLTAKNNQLQADLDRFAVPVTLYFVTSTSTDSYLMPVTRLVARTGDPPRQAVEQLLKGPDAGSGLSPVLPADTKLLGLEVRNGTAYVDFSPEVRHLNVGSRGEALTLAAIADTLTEFPEIKQVQILVQGKVIDSLGGHIAADQPLSRNETLVKR